VSTLRPPAFISYSREDADFALRLAQDLRGAGASVWLDQLDIRPGSMWDSAIEDAIVGATHMVVVLSPSSHKSNNVRNEISFALAAGKIVIPVLYKDSGIPFSLRRFQCVDFRTDYARGFAQALALLGETKATETKVQAADRHVPQDNPQLPFEAYVGLEPYVFASYSHKDDVLVFPELMSLHQAGVRIWYDEGVAPAAEWPEYIAGALDQATSFLVFISRNAVQSRNVRNEIGMALKRDKPFLAVHLEDTPLPLGLELRMGDIQAIMKWKVAEDYYRRKINSAFPASVRDQLPIPRQREPIY